MRIAFRTAALVALIFGQGVAHAATVTSNFTARITIDGECLITTTNALDFGNAGVLVSEIDEATTFQIQCTNTVPYGIGLSAGTGVGATTLMRRMTSGSATVNYQMFSDPSRTVNWGNDFGVDTVSHIGNGSPQTFIVYGRVVPQATPEAGTYTDTVQITVEY